MLWTLFGSGRPDVLVFTEVLTRVGLPAVPPVLSWSLGSTVHMLDYVPKNKPFLIGEATISSETQRYLDMCPSAGTHARWLLQKLAPCHDPRWDAGYVGGCYGCKSDNVADFGYVYSSKTNLAGFVEGIVSSLANWKLYALGLKHFEWTSEFLTVAPDQLFSHPLRPAEETAAGAVIHTLYCCGHLLEWYDAVYAIEPNLFGVQYRRGVFRERVQRGVEQVETIIPHTTTNGAELLTAMCAWGRTMLGGA